MKLFTVDEANALLPQLTVILEDLQRLQQHMAAAAREVAEFEHLAAQNGHGRDSRALNPQNDLSEVGRAIEQRLLQLRRMGCQLKDIEHGVVDFPARVYGRDVYLCWRLGEPRVEHWHETEGGFAGRRRI